MPELLIKGAFEPLTGGAGFYSNMFVVPNHLGGLHHILSLKQFNHCMYIPSFRMPIIKQVGQLIHQGDYAFSNELKYAYLYVPFVKHHHHFFMICLVEDTLSVEGVAIWTCYSA